MLLRKLAVSNFLARKTRVALTVAAIALSVSLVVAVTTGYNSVEAAVHFFIDKYMGATDARSAAEKITRGAGSRSGWWMRFGKTRRSRRPTAAWRSIRRSTTRKASGSRAKPAGVRRRDAGGRGIDTLQLEKGRWFKTSDATEAVIDQGLAQEIKADLGSTITLKGSHDTKLTVVGVVHKPELIATQVWTIYVPLTTLQHHLGEGWDTPPGFVNRVTVELKKGTDPRRRADELHPPSSPQIDPAAKLRLTRDTRAEVDKNLGSIRLLSYLGGTVSMLAATFIVFSALSMGVSERQRTLAMLRAVGAFRADRRAGLAEGMLLSAIGVVDRRAAGALLGQDRSPGFQRRLSAGVVRTGGGSASARSGRS